MEKKRIADLGVVAVANSAVAGAIQIVWVGSFLAPADSLIYVSCLIVLATTLTWLRLSGPSYGSVIAGCWGAAFGLIGGVVGYLTISFSSADAAERLERSIRLFPTEFPIVVVGVPIVLLSWVVGLVGGIALVLARRHRESGSASAA